MLRVNHLIGFGAGGASGNDSFTKWLLHGNGADASTTITDSSTAAHTTTANGNAQIDTAQSKFGGASILFDGTGDYVSTDGSSDFAFGNGDWTVDFWVRMSNISSYRVFYDGRPSGTNGAYVNIYALDGALRYATNSTEVIIAGSLSADTWYHVAVARASTSTKMFLDGTQVGSTYSDSTNYLIGASRPVLGIAGTDLSSFALAGWMDEVRVSKGIARWTANFTPPTAAYD